MGSYAAFLRGINVGGHRISGPELRAHFEQMGLREVSTFRASGNVVFDAGDVRPTAIGGRIEQALVAALGYEVPVFLRTAGEVRAIAARRALAPEPPDRPHGKLQVAFLTAAPTAQARDEVLALATDQDQLAVGERELYWLPRGGISDSTLDLKAVERVLGTITIRTKGTVEALAAKFFAG